MKNGQDVSVSIIIVSFNTVALLRDCLSSVTPQLASGDEVIVIDNASTDGSPEMVADRFPNTILIASDTNLGFGRANNRGITKAKNAFIWLLNSDTRLTPMARNMAVAFMERNRKFGMAGTALINPDGSPQSSVETRYPGQRYARSLLDDLPGQIAWVMGASIIVRRDILRLVGGFDEGFFLYGEEIDLCLMVRQAGWPIGFIDDAVVIHLGGQSERGQMPITVVEKKLNAEMLFYEKHYNKTVIKRIRRKNRIQAAWRILTLWPLCVLFPNDGNVVRKFAFYRLSWKFFGQDR